MKIIKEFKEFVKLQERDLQDCSGMGTTCLAKSDKETIKLFEERIKWLKEQVEEKAELSPEMGGMVLLTCDVDYLIDKAFKIQK